ncbi:F-box protein [Salix suchowensis]|nr:F-box protein [Salix suchowensis]
MKLRLRSVQSKETVKIQVPNSCTLQQLKETLSGSIFSAGSSLYLSLNRKDELNTSVPEDSLQSLGITSGDLIYFSVNPQDFSSSGQPLCLGSSSSIQEQVQGHRGNVQEPMSDQLMSFQESKCSGLNMPENQDLLVQGHAGVQANDTSSRETKSEISPHMHLLGQRREIAESDMDDAVTEGHGALGLKTQSGETLETQELTSVEAMNVDPGSVDVGNKRFSEPYFLRRLLRKELGDDGSNYKLLVIAVHAVFIESGFVGFDSISGMRVDGFHLPKENSSRNLALSLCYTLPELLDGKVIAETIVLKLQSLGHFVNVYGSLAKGGSGLYRACLNINKFAPTIDFVWGNDKNDGMNGSDGSSILYSENEIFEFWKIVKDGLALPLLIDICEKAGLVLPSCLMRLPTELKLKILELLPVIDIAKMGRVSSEMRYLSSNNDLWKQKFVEEFGDGTEARGTVNWKERFASYWENKKRKRDVNAWRESRLFLPFHVPIRRDPNPFGFPSTIGGDYDRLPGLGIPPYRRPGLGWPQPRRNFSPNCNLGGFSS